MRRHLLKFAVLLSLLLCLGTIALWVRSYSVEDMAISEPFGIHQVIGPDGTSKPWHVQWEMFLGRGNLQVFRSVQPATSRARPGWRSFPAFPMGELVPADSIGPRSFRLLRQKQSFRRARSGHYAAMFGELGVQFDLWVPMIAFSVLPALAARRLWSVHRSPSGTCASCGYNLTGNTSGVCPECGAAVSPIASAPPTAEAIARHGQPPSGDMEQNARSIGQLLRDIAKTPGIQTITVFGTYDVMGGGPQIYDQTFRSEQLRNLVLPIPDGMTPTIEVSGAVRAGSEDIVAAINEGRIALGLGPFPGSLLVARSQPSGGMLLFVAAFQSSST